MSSDPSRTFTSPRVWVPLLVGFLVAGWLLLDFVPIWPGEEADPPAVCSSRRAPPDRLVAGERWLYDDRGRTVFLRGLNYSHRSKWPPFTDWMEEKHLREMARWGANSVRLVLMWEALEPRRDQFDESYLRDVRRVIRWADKHDMKVQLDIHQDLWARFFGGSGAPRWATVQVPTDETYEFVDAWNYRYLRSDVMTNWDRFWSENPFYSWRTLAGILNPAAWTRTPPPTELQREYVEAWRKLVREFRGEPNVIGYEIMNEPWPGRRFLSPFFEPYYLAPFYRRVIDGIRELDPHRPIFVEPWVLEALGFPSFLPRLERDNLVLAPHTYDMLMEAFQAYTGRTHLAWLYGGMEEDRGELGMPAVIGEWGVIRRDHPSAEQFVLDHLDLLNEHRMAGTYYWDYNPTVRPPGEVRVDTPSRARHVVPSKRSPVGRGGYEAPFLDELIHPYPRAVSGVPLSIDWDYDTKRFQLTYRSCEGADGPTEIAVPERHFPDGVRPEFGGNGDHVTGDYRSGEGRFIVRDEPGERVHTVILRPR